MITNSQLESLRRRFLHQLTFMSAHEECTEAELIESAINREMERLKRKHVLSNESRMYFSRAQYADLPLGG